MSLEGQRILITGAAGGIGQQVARMLASRRAKLALLDRDAESLGALAAELQQLGGIVEAFPVDLLDDKAREIVLVGAMEALGGIDMLVNIAGLLSFRPYADEDPGRLDALLRLNLGVPMQLSRAVLPQLIEQGSGRIVNVGSTFGSIGFAYFAAYSASKAGLRGFSEALRRELADTGVGVTYVAPRAVKTPLNSDAVMRMAERVKMNMDAPEWVAARIVEAMEKGRKEVFLGFPESLFVRINAILPRLVDGALRKQNRAMAEFAGK